MKGTVIRDPGDRMRRRVVRWLIGLLATLCLTCCGGPLWFVSRAGSNLEKHVTELKRLGVPTTPDELRATLPKDGDNAASLYLNASRILGSASGERKQAIEAVKNGIGRKATPTQRSAARDALSQLGAELALFREAASKPRCVFERKYEDGFNLLYPELAHMKTGAKIVLVAGEANAAEDDLRAAYRDVMAVNRMASHARARAHPHRSFG